MNHGLIMLREVKRMRRLAKSLAKEVKFRAVKSHSCANVKNGTLGQIEEICQLIQLRDECLLFCIAVHDGLDAIDNENRWLIANYYVKRLSVDAIAARFKVSASRVYTKLYYARMQFNAALNKLGYDEWWLRDNFGHFDFITARLDT